jgi:hypothetical protein
MLFDKPIPFAEALQSRKAKRILPTTAGSAELAELPAQIRERAMFSARTANAGYLAKMDRLLSEMTSPATRSARGESAIDPGTFRLQMRAELEKLGYQPEPGKAGSLTDLGSDARLNLIVKMQTEQAYGYGQHVQGQDPDLLDMFPCQELVRIEGRKEERDWISRWVRAGGKLYGGRMIARKDDGIWTAISRFGTPYPPFDFGSGMGLRDVDRKEAESLGVIKRSDIVKPDTRRLTDNVEAAMPKGISSGLAQALQQVFKVQAGKIILESVQSAL